jgi:hypothetical protein
MRKFVLHQFDGQQGELIRSLTCTEITILGSAFGQFLIRFPQELLWDQREMTW